MIADRHAMGIAAEIAQHRRGPTEGRLRVDDPVGVEKPIDEGAPTGGVAECRRGAGEVELVAHVRTAECGDEFAAKHTTEDLHRQEKARVLWTDPALAIR